jgi:hypothetical protein
MNTDRARELLVRKLVAQRAAMETAERYADNTQPLRAFMDPEIDKSLNGRVRPLNVAIGGLAVDVLAQRLSVVGFSASPTDLSDQGLWDLWRRNDMGTQSELAHTAALVYGRAYYLAWTGPDGAPRITVESPMQCTVLRDPLTGSITHAIKRWIDPEGYSRTLLFSADEVIEYASPSMTSPDPLVPTTALPITGEDAIEVSRQRNPLGIVPMVALVNRPSLTNLDGVSELRDLAPIIDAIGKLSSDLMVASEYSASPRRYVTGLFPDTRMTQEQAKELADTIRDAWETAYAAKILVAPDHRTQFGSFDVATLDNYIAAITLLMQQAAAIAALPPYYLTLPTANPTSADAIRAAEQRLTAKAEQRQRQWSGAYADLMRLALTIRDGRPYTGLIETQWRSAAPATLAQTADAEAKLVGAGIVDRATALAALGYTPLDIERITTTEGILA